MGDNKVEKSRIFRGKNSKHLKILVEVINNEEGRCPIHHLQIT
jgi:hypothetical protein